MIVLQKLCRMVFNQFLHLSPAPTLRPSIAFFLIITILAVPFFALSSELIRSTLFSLALPLWDSLLGLFTSPPFYYFLLNFLVVTLVFTSGVLGQEEETEDGQQEGDLHARGHPYYSTSAQMIYERLALDEFYGTQASSLPYISYTENSNVCVEDALVMRSVYAEDEAVIVGNQMIMSPSASSLLQEAEFSHMEGSAALLLCALEENTCSSSESIRMDMGKESAVTDGDGSEKKKLSLISSVGMNHEGTVDDGCHACKQFQAEEGKVVDDDDDDEDEDEDDDEDYCHDDDVDGDDDYHHVVDDDHDDDKQLALIQCPPGDSSHSSHQHDMGAENWSMGSSCVEDLRDDGKSPHDVSMELSHEDSIGIGGSSGDDEDDVGAMQRLLGNGECCMNGDEGGREEEEFDMSAEELNRRASDFITAFRRQLILTANNDQLG